MKTIIEEKQSTEKPPLSFWIQFEKRNQNTLQLFNKLIKKEEKFENIFKSKLCAQLCMHTHMV